MDQNYSSTTPEQTGEIVSFNSESNSNVQPDIAQDSIVTSYGVVSRKDVETLISKSLPRKSKTKRFLSWFFGIIGTVTFLFVCGCLSYAAFGFASDKSDSDNSIYSYDDDFFVIPDDGSDYTDDEPISGSDTIIPSQTSNAGLGVVVTALDTASAQMYGISGGLVIVGIPENSSFIGTDVRVYDMITAAEGVEITSTTALSVLLNKHQIGDEFTVTITRFVDGFAENFDVTVILIDKTA